MKLLNYTEFLAITEFPDKTAEKRFSKFLKDAESDYLPELIGSELVLKLMLGDYTELMKHVREALAYKIMTMFAKLGDRVFSGGMVRRNSDNHAKSDYNEREELLKYLYRTLRVKERDLIRILIAGDYTEYSGNKKISTKLVFNLTAIG